MCHTVRTTVPRDAAAVHTARVWAREQLAQLYARPDSELVADACLTVSELVTNCVRANAHDLTVSLVAHRTELVVATTDDAPGAPRQLAPADVSPTGRGLQLIAALSAQWGVSPEDGRKTVWARFAVSDTPGASFACSGRAH